MERLVAQVHDLLIREKKSIAVAESCTGGLVSNLLTQLSGSSQYFILGVVAYSNKAKEDVLKIPHSTISKKGSVSEETAKKMAQSIRKLIGADFGIGITGIAGPRGATAKKPIGTVFIAIDSKNTKLCERFFFRGNRLAIREQTALKTLELLKKLL